MSRISTKENKNIYQTNGLYAITNLGAILLAKRLSDFPRISRKAIRVVQYQGNNLLNMLKEDVGGKGYVVGFEGLIKFIEALLPTQEVITGALREKKSAYPVLAVREAVANALIHQDFSVTGTGPVVEIFESRIEITNSGTPLVDVRRIIDNPPKSRNEKLAALMRRLRMCEELGTGWDKIVITCELYQLPAPKIELFEDSTRVTLFSEMPFSNISMEDMRAQKRLSSGKGGIIWHTQGSGKSLTMIWLSKWLLSNIPTARVLIVTDRDELDEQIERNYIPNCSRTSGQQSKI